MSRNLSIGTCAAVAAGITWAIASGVVVLHPATISGVLTLSSETVTSLSVRAYPPSGSAVQREIAIPAGTPGPYSFAITVDGGDPADANDPGVAYRPVLYAYLSNPTAAQTYLYLQKNTAITVDNTPGSPAAEVNTAFSYPTTHRANVSVSVTGGTINNLQLYAYASNTPDNESYQAYAYTDASDPRPTTTTTWLPMVPNSNVTVYGTAFLVASDGTTSQRSLASQTLDLSQGSRDVAWTIDLTNTGSLEGDIALVAAPTSSATPSSYTVVFQGASSATSGISGSVQTTPSEPHYALTLTPGDYDVFLRTSFSPSSQYSETPKHRVTVVAATTQIEDFTEELGVGRLALDVTGFYRNEDLAVAYSYLRGPQYEYRAFSHSATGGVFEHTVPAGIWQPYYTYLYLQDQTNPELPLNTQIYRHIYTDAATPPTAVGAGADVALGTSAFTLVRSNVYFEVVETTGAQASISNPSIQAYKYEYNADSSIKSYSRVYANSASTSQSRAGLTMVAEPGEYVLDARAYVGDTLTRFAGTSITFGEPVATPAATDVEVVLTPVQNPDLRISLAFPEVTGAGISTVVETPLGPAPPSGLRTLCEQNEDGVTCAPIYYDISTTASWTSPVTVCVRRLVMGVPNAAANFLRLYHYDEHATGADKWEVLSPPEGQEPAIDCSTDPAACGCADEASCGIDLEADPQLNVFQVCGVTTSFSPFAIFQGDVKFSNEVEGHEYTGPTGPPSLQQWTVPGTATYRITATGAQGGSATSAPLLAGGCGAEVAGDFTLQQGDVLQLLVGQKGTAASNNAGGGGGTFVTKNGMPLVIAGGGGGVRSTALVNGRGGSLTSSGTAGSTSTTYASGFIPGGSNGAGGSRISGYGAGGGGWSGNGASDGTYGEGGFSFLGANQGKGGSGKGCGVPAHGGYGGGGAGNGCYGAGGGGGYSGGGGGRVAGGGGSLNNGLNPTASVPDCTTGTGHGLVRISLLPN